MTTCWLLQADSLERVVRSLLASVCAKLKVGSLLRRVTFFILEMLSVSQKMLWCVAGSFPASDPLLCKSVNTHVANTLFPPAMLWLL